MPTTKEPAAENDAPFDASVRDGEVEAILLASDRAVTAGRIAEALEITADEGGARVVHDAIGRLNATYEQTGRSFRIEKVAGGYRAVTMSDYADAIAAFQAGKAQRRLSRAALETLSIIAYRQPVTRAEVEAIRGVAGGEVLRSLLERRLIAITGRAEEVGRPMLYGTTRRFLEVFGIASVRDLPAPENFKPRPAPSDAPGTPDISSPEAESAAPDDAAEQTIDPTIDLSVDSSAPDPTDP